jgi:hypothetical protein
MRYESIINNSIYTEGSIKLKIGITNIHSTYRFKKTKLSCFDSVLISSISRLLLQYYIFEYLCTTYKYIKHTPCSIINLNWFIFSVSFSVVALLLKPLWICLYLQTSKKLLPPTKYHLLHLVDNDHLHIL